MTHSSYIGKDKMGMIEKLILGDDKNLLNPLALLGAGNDNLDPNKLSDSVKENLFEKFIDSDQSSK